MSKTREGANCDTKRVGDRLGKEREKKNVLRFDERTCDLLQFGGHDRVTIEIERKQRSH